ncbi:MAG: hypothetical protein KF702_04625 [Gammaproteobacteria bacterium]|nr:hypothetical protein [Gammaproteobacteria bacterium]
MTSFLQEEAGILYEPFTRRQESARAKPSQGGVCFAVKGEGKIPASSCKKLVMHL